MGPGLGRSWNQSGSSRGGQASWARQAHPRLPPAPRPPGLAVILEDLSWRRTAVRSGGRGSCWGEETDKWESFLWEQDQGDKGDNEKVEWRRVMSKQTTEELYWAGTEKKVSTGNWRIQQSRRVGSRLSKEDRNRVQLFLYRFIWHWFLEPFSFKVCL